MDRDQPSFRLIRTSKGGQKLLEGGYLYLMHRRVGEMSDWQCEQGGESKARVHTKRMEIVKRTNEHLHAPDVHSYASLSPFPSYEPMLSLSLSLHANVSNILSPTSLLISSSFLTVPLPIEVDSGRDVVAAPM
ncbi:hypothetical protein LOD99_906 [Oopsacas minuta]|uniref:FLYWCH-type domain-containing protein n=1 Tax=Oopsacas minuta TaxID=111878 RepID=A0AAV7K0B1_9METZ|nr:hypothetical protein LOD99_906 [Oopsacas minuta]